MELDENISPQFDCGARLALGALRLDVISFSPTAQHLIDFCCLGLQQERVEDRRLAATIRADQYDKSRRRRKINYLEISESLVVHQVYAANPHEPLVFLVFPVTLL